MSKMPYLPQDFAACSNKACPVRQTCWRTNPNPDAKRQVWAHFSHHLDGGCAEQLDPPKEQP